MEVNKTLMAKTAPKITLSPPLWPTAGGPGQRRAVSRTSPAELTVAWRVAFKDQITPPVVGGDGTIYVGGFDKHLYAFSPAGALALKKKFIGPIMSDPAIGATGLIFVAPHHRPPTGLETTLCAIDPTRPKGDEIVWSVTFAGAARPLLPHPDGGVLAVSSGGVLHSVNAAGIERFAARFGESSSVGPTLLSDGTTVVLAEEGRTTRVIGLAPDGGQRFAVTVPSTIAPATALDDGGFWLLSVDGARRRMDADGREVAVLPPLDASAFFQCGLALRPDGGLWVARSQRHAGALIDLDPTGAVRGQVSLGDGAGPALGFIDGAALVAARDGTLTLVTAEREIAWSLPVGDPASEASGATPAPVVPSLDGFVTRVDGASSANSERQPCELVGLAAPR